MQIKPIGDLSASELEEFAADANSFFNSKSFEYIMGTMREKYIQQLVQANVGDLTAASAHASMKVLEDFKGELQVFQNELQIRKRNFVRTR